MSGGSLSRRKQDHIRIALEERVTTPAPGTGLSRYRFRHCALPEMALSDVRLETTFLGRCLAAPILLSSMTGGAPQAASINRNLARAAQALGLAMGLGSARAAIEDPACSSTYRVRDVAPDVLLFANLGAVQLNYGYGVDQCRRAIEISEADALMLHLNPLQEGLQRGGNTNFAGLLGAIERVCRSLGRPVVVKEVGWGLSVSVVRDLAQAGVSAVDVAGAGGTSWSEMEGFLARTAHARQLAQDFGGWGIPTAECVIAVRRQFPTLPLIASGGIRSGVDAAKVIALGADMAGLARVLLGPAAKSDTDAFAEAQRIVEGMRLAAWCAGAPNIERLKTTPLDCHAPFAAERSY